MIINFVCGSLNVCGGVRTIFELSNGLVDRGHEVYLTELKRSPRWFNPIKAKIVTVDEIGLLPRFIRKFYLRKRKIKYDLTEFVASRFPNCDVTIATYSLTALPTFLCGTGRLFYFVQHYEPLFFSNPIVAKQAEISYLLPMTKLCVSHWLQEKVGGVYIGNGIDLSRFHPKSKEWKDTVMLFARKSALAWKKPEKTVQIATALRECGFYVVVVDGSCAEEQLIEHYARAKFIVYLSDMEGFGLIPLEAMASKAIVVSTNCCEYFKHLENVFLLPDVNAQAIIETLNRIRSTPKLEDKLIDGGLKTAQFFNIKEVVNRLENCLMCA